MIQENVSLKPFNTFGIDVKAKLFAQFSSVEELKSILRERKNEPLHIIGGGSNILYTKDVNALVLKNEIDYISVYSEDEDSITLNVGGGVVWHEFVIYCVENDFGGIENLSLIPGSVGASPMQNIGAYGVEIKDVFVSLKALNIETLEVEEFNNEDCKFGYRESIFKNSHKGKYIITEVTYKLTKNKHSINTQYGIIEQQLKEMQVQTPTIKDVSNAVIAIRQSKLPDPNEIGNAGSFFKNPVISKEEFDVIKQNHPDIPSYPSGNDIKLAAGWLIDQAGWKGKTINNYGVHKKQALVLVNYGGCQGVDILNLSQKIIQDIQSKFGITLVREVNIL